MKSINYLQMTDIVNFVPPKSLKYLYIAKNPLNKEFINRCQELNSDNLKILY